MRDYSPSGQSSHFSETQLVNTTIIQLINMEFLNVILIYPDLEIHKWIFTCLILLCVVMSNIFFTLFRAYQASLPTHKYILLNILFSHLSILWQSSNLVCSVFTITEVIFSVNSPALSCILYLIRQFQILAIPPPA